MLEEPRSPLFPAELLAPNFANREEFLLPQLPDLPTLQTSSYRAYLVTTEKHLFVQGFTAAEYEDRPPTLLRGCLVVHVLKATKLLKSLGLVFKAVLKTDWPEGIPPKKQLYAEHLDLISHTWPFYNLESPAPNAGADLFVPGAKATWHDDVLTLNLAEMMSPQLTLVDSAALLALRNPSADLLSPVPSRADLDGDWRRGYFSPGFYVYNFEHPIPPLVPESIHLTFGRVSYSLELTIARAGAFKPNLVAKVPVEVVRIPLENSVEENEPIIIERDWEEHMRYEIVVGSKAVVLDSYVPINFRFIPLLSKVQLHRIRVYVTENCNYYCNNKAVHRAEPVRKFLLLEHKAKKNQLLMSKSGGMSETPPADDDEVLPRELEFQMYVPSVINKKYNYCMHPDTSSDNIQCDHWLKISLRISRQDSENPEKRKHFEILIDSPIHLCSPLAAHSHTLLPSYDMEPDFLPVYSPNSPPMSPGVTPLDYSLQGVGRLLFSAFASGGHPPGHSATASPGPPIPRSVTPIEFHRIASSDNNQTPIERDLDLHLEANLYEPGVDEVRENLSSPQARPFSPQLRPYSPLPHLASPVASPANFAAPFPRRPTVNPPSFDQPGVSQGVLPPAYKREDPALDLPSLPPMRLDGTNPNLNPLIFGGSSEPGIKDLLNKHLDKRARNSQSDRESIRSNYTARSSDKESIKTRRSSDKESIRTPRSKNGDRDSIHSHLEPLFGGKDAGKLLNAPKCELKENESNLKTDSDSVEPSANAQPVSPMPHMILPAQGASMASSSFAEGDDLVVDKFDLTGNLSQLGVDFTGHKPKSRASSFSLLNSLALGLEDAPLDQTLPLLSLSSTSVIDGGGCIFDDPQGGLAGNPSMTDLVDTHYFGHDEHRVIGSLLLLRNPRIKKHYQDPPQLIEPVELAGLLASPKSRQKSFGVISRFEIGANQFKDAKRNSSGSDFTIDEVPSQNGGKAEPYIELPEFQTVVFNK